MQTSEEGENLHVSNFSPHEDTYRFEHLYELLTNNTILRCVHKRNIF